MKNLESLAIRKEKLLQRLRSLSPKARKAILLAALELKQERADTLATMDTESTKGKDAIS